MSSHPKWKNRWTFAKECRKNQVAYRSFIGEAEAVHDLYALAKTKHKNKIRNRWKAKMKTITTSLALIALLFTVGCRNASPLSLTLGTATIVKYGLRNSPKTVGYLRDIQPSICALANGEALTPDDLANAIDAVDTDDSKEGLAIVTGVTLLYIAAYDSLGSNTNSESVRPYTKAICEGVTIGLGPEPATVSKSRNAPPVVVTKWRLPKR